MAVEKPAGATTISTSTQGCNEEQDCEPPVNLCERFEVDFLPPGTSVVDLTTRMRSRFTEEEDKASVIYVGCSSLTLLNNADENLLDICKDNCRLIIESALWVTSSLLSPLIPL